MAIPFLNNINLSNNELQNARLHNTGSANTNLGQIYFDTSDNLAKYYSNGVDTWVSLKEYSFSNGTFVNLSTSGTTAKPIITADLSATGTPDATVYLRGDNTWSPISAIPGTYTWSITGDNGTSSTVTSGNTVDIAGGTNITTAADLNDTVTVNLDDSITLAGTLTVNGTGQSSFAGQVTIPIIPVASTDAASKDYVDNAVVGGLVYQGGYDADTNSPDLTTSPNTILKGWTYTVTVKGVFFGEQLRIGDVLIAEQDNPTALADWTTVQDNIDFASLTQVGIGNVNAGTGISVAYGNGTATVTNTETNSSNTYATTITDTATVTHSLSTKDVIVQLYDIITDETVYADVERITTSQARITFSATPTNDVRVLVQKIG